MGFDMSFFKDAEKITKLKDENFRLKKILNEIYGKIYVVGLNTTYYGYRVKHYEVAHCASKEIAEGWIQKNRLDNNEDVQYSYTINEIKIITSLE